MTLNHEFRLTASALLHARCDIYYQQADVLISLTRSTFHSILLSIQKWKNPHKKMRNP